MYDFDETFRLSVPEALKSNFMSMFTCSSVLLYL